MVDLSQTSNSKLKFRRISLLLLSLSIVLWAISIYWSRLEIGDFGLIHGIHPLFFVSVFILTISFFITIKQNIENKALLILHLICAVGFFILIPVLIEGTPRFTYNYVTLHHADFILQTGHSNHHLMPYQSWPGIFYFAAILTHITGMSPTALLLYIPIILGIINIPLAFLLFSTLLDSKKEIWAVFLLGVAFWGAPIYFLPGVLGGMMAAYAITILLGRELIQTKASVRIKAIVLIFFATAVISHALASVILAITLIYSYALAAGWKKHRDFTMPISLLILLVSWGVFFVGGYFFSILRDFHAHMFDYGLTIYEVHRMGFIGSEAHTQMVWIRIISASVFTLLAIIGFLYTVISQRKLTFKTALLPTWIAAGCSMGLLTSYYGEILSRSFAASGTPLQLLAAKNITGKFVSGLLLTFLIIVPPVSIINAYGNQAADWVSPAEIRGVEFFSSHAPQGAEIATLRARIWGFRYTANYRRVALSPDSFSWQASDSTKDFVLVGERDIATYTFFGGTIDVEALRSIDKSPFYGKIFTSDGFDIYKRLTPASG